MFKGGIASMMQKAQKMQQQVKTAQSEIKILSITSKNNGIEFTINGLYQISNLQLTQETKNNPELTTLLENSFNNASVKIKQLSDEKLKNVTGGIDLGL